MLETLLVILAAVVANRGDDIAADLYSWGGWNFREEQD